MSKADDEKSSARKNPERKKTTFLKKEDGLFLPKISGHTHTD